jgi:hypothetical protein
VCTGGATRCCRPVGAVRVFGRDLGKWSKTVHHPDNDLINRSAAWSIVAEEARPPRAVSSTRLESNSGCDEAPVHCVIMVATARQPARGPNLVLSF